MRVVLNNVLPFRGFVAMNICGVIFVRMDEWIDLSDEDKLVTVKHENIHTAQMRELLFLPFYIIYILEWFIQLFIHPKSAYRSISFEREAYANQTDPDYLKTRKHYAQWR